MSGNFRGLYHRNRRIIKDQNNYTSIYDRYAPYVPLRRRYNYVKSSKKNNMATSISTVVSAFVIFFLGISVLLHESESSQCKQNSYCNCTQQTSANKYELKCAAVRGPIVVIIYVDFVNTKVICERSSSSNNVSSWTDMLADLDLRDTVSLMIEHCPIPNVPFDVLFKSANITNVERFYFQSFFFELSSKSTDNTNEFFPYHFENLNTVRKLHLEHNQLTRLSSATLAALKSMAMLDELNLSKNNISKITSTPTIARSTAAAAADTAESKKAANILKRLDIGETKLTEINGLLDNLPELEVLILYENQLGGNVFRRSTFEKVPLLKSLDLSSNNVTELPGDVFVDLTLLVDLNLNKNYFAALPSEIFNRNRNLKRIRLNFNRRPLSLPGKLFADLPSLKELSLTYNNLPDLPADLISGSKNLTTLQLTGNKLKRLPKHFFEDAASLELLDVSVNQLTDLDDDLFGPLINLNRLYLKMNHLKTINEHHFGRLVSLTHLDLSSNKLETADIRYLNKLEWISLSNNSLKVDDANSSLLIGCNHLEEIYLSKNRLSVIPSHWMDSFTKLRILRLDSNNFTEYIFPNGGTSVSENIKIDLTNNSISMVDAKNLEASASELCYRDPIHCTNYPDRKIEMVFTGNPLNCDCRSYSLARYFQSRMSKLVYAYFKLYQSTCSQPEQWKDKSITEIDLSRITCRWEDASNLLEPCPSQCDCSFRPHDKAAIANCSNARLTDIPESLPFGDFINHTELILAHNRIGSLNSLVNLPVYRNVTKFDLSHNSLKHINVSLFTPKLQELKLDNNQFTQLNYDSLTILNRSEYLEHLTLHGNPWKCDCDTQHFVYFLHKKFKEIKYLDNITCADSGKSIIKLSVDDLCYISLSIFIGCALLAALGLMAGALVAFYYRYQQEIRVWLFTHKLCLWLVAEKELDRHKKYDAFISYSHLDESFVVEHLVPGLEGGTPRFKLCLHFRDFVPGEWIPNQIIKSVENSRRTIVVLSPRFLNSVWGKMEFRTAHLKAMKEGCARVIVILYADVDTKKLDPELKAYLSTNTYLRWDDTSFWNKLRYALPHPPEYCKQLPMAKLRSGGNNSKLSMNERKKKKVFKNSIAYSKTNNQLSSNNNNNNNNNAIDSSSEHEEKIRQLNKLYGYQPEQI